MHVSNKPIAIVVGSLQLSVNFNSRFDTGMFDCKNASVLIKMFEIVIGIDSMNKELLTHINS